MLKSTDGDLTNRGFEPGGSPRGPLERIAPALGGLALIAFSLATSDRNFAPVAFAVVLCLIVTPLRRDPAAFASFVALSSMSHLQASMTVPFTGLSVVVGLMLWRRPILSLLRGSGYGLLIALATIGFVASSAFWLSHGEREGYERMDVGRQFAMFSLQCLFPALLPCVLGAVVRDEKRVARTVAFLVVGFTALLVTHRAFGTPGWEEGGQGFTADSYTFLQSTVLWKRTQVGTVLAVLTAAAAAGVIHERRGRLRLLLFAALLSAAFLLVEAASIGSLVAAAASIGVIAALALWSRAHRVAAFMSLAVGVAVIATAFIWMPAVLGSRAEWAGARAFERFAGITSIQDIDRYARWRDGLRQFAAVPTGIGWATQTLTVDGYHTHSVYLDYLMSYGVFGLLYFVGLILCSLTYLGRAYLRDRTGGSPAAAVAAVGLAALIAFAVNSMFDHFDANALFYQFALTLISLCVANCLAVRHRSVAAVRPRWGRPWPNRERGQQPISVG